MPQHCAGDVVDATLLARMKSQLTHTVPVNSRNKAGPREMETQAKFWEFDWVCVDQETIVVYDPKQMADVPIDGVHRRRPISADEQLPKLDFSKDDYYFRQATPKLAQDTLAALGHQDAATMSDPSPIILGHKHTQYNTRSEIPVRLASPDEMRQLSSPFSRCTIPLVFHTLWLHNLNEWFVRAPVAFHKYQKAGLLPKELSITLFSPLKIPVPNFNKIALRPFSHYDVTSFADFSARRPESTPSNATAEGTHKRCFRKLLVWRDTRENRPAAPALGPLLLDFHANHLAHFDRTLPPMWKSDAPSHMRILVEQRARYGHTRQFLDFPALLTACNAPSAVTTLHRHIEGAAPAKRSFSTVECVSHEFGAHPAGFLHDMWAMRKVDVFVTFHGAGQMNAIFLPLHSSMVEVRGINASMNLADHWHPQISRGSHFQYFWWGLIAQDPAYVERSGLDSAGFYGDADHGNWKAFMFRKRDQNVRLTWPHLSFMLRHIVQVDRNATLFANMFGKFFEYYNGGRGHSGVVYEIRQGYRVPQLHKVATPHG